MLWFTFILPLLLFPGSSIAGRESRSQSLQGRSYGTLLTVRDGDHHHKGTPLLELDEEAILREHDATPESYYTIDWEDPEHAPERHPGFMVMHILSMSAAFFVALPMGIAMRSVNHAWHGVVMVSFYGFALLGCATSGIYRKLTPNMYEGNVHGKQGYLLLTLSVVLTTIDLLNIFRRVVSFIRSGERFQPRAFWNQVVRGKEDANSGGEIELEYAHLIAEDPEELVPSPPLPHKRVDSPSDEHGPTARWANEVSRHRRDASEATLYGPRSSHSDDTLHETDGSHSHHKPALMRRIGSGVFATSERVLVFWAFAQVLSGITVYIGGCRGNYLQSCLAHLIKGGIFWCYGLFTFARYLGTFSELGWAWNRAPRKFVSGEFVESLVIFFYGITNTWMERFGAEPGSPFTTKQIQHIGIAVMFWFAGLLGMALESKLVRRWLAMSPRPTAQDEATPEPPSYVASFNPFPALVIGVTGAAMAAHHQNYVFQIQVHQLWGGLLLAWAVLRWLTYFFLWVSPPQSYLPSRPPTEALGSFFLACGGLCFMLSNEEITFAAMRRGRDDVMMFLNVAVAFTCFAMVWTLCVVAFKGYLKAKFKYKSRQGAA
ncbi:hypothetical protein E1B28_004497 [Marasmius oreades]|uniref:Cytoplasmic protein n=1 Tax=Marasmius oreades TaxID=181124 RepID=A0A9P7UYQ3_9AGAR|nr:uncharacterized protein E1B28_004497 [Marasmius oreades]KAG7097119.1 hypothetical protein E1B28_004497 [Marasmius oreades]